MKWTFLTSAGLLFALGVTTVVLEIYSGSSYLEHRDTTQTLPQAAVRRGLALQLPFCFEVRTLSDRLVSSAPE